MESGPFGHEPVLIKEVLDLLQVTETKTIVDCTLGRGGHALAIAARLGSGQRAADDDGNVLLFAKVFKGLDERLGFNDAGVGRPQRGNGADIWLARANERDVGVNNRHAVPGRNAVQLVQHFDLVLVRRDHQLAAPRMRHVMPGAKGIKAIAAFDAKPRLE